MKDEALKPHYSQGVCMDGAAILKDGQMMTIDEIVAELNRRPAPDARLVEALVAHQRLLSELRERFGEEFCSIRLPSEFMDRCVEVSNLSEAALKAAGAKTQDRSV